MSKLGGWFRLWVVISALAIVAAVALAYWMPDYYAAVSDKERKVGPEIAKFSSTSVLSDKTVTMNRCLVGSLQESVDEQIDDNWTISGGFHCTSYDRLYTFVGISIIFSLILLILGFAVRWVRKGFQRQI